MANYNNKNLQIFIWSFIVLIFSTLCYLPMLLERSGKSFPNILINAKYLFVLVPLVVSICFVLKEHNTKQWIKGLFECKKCGAGLFLCLGLAAIGICSTFLYSHLTSQSKLLTVSYPNFISLAVQCAYLFAMAFLEETAWRGFLLDKLSMQKQRIRYTLFSGMIWGLWHIPMWYIRNMLGLWDIALLFLWCLLLAIILGILRYQHNNILLCALLHAIFNLCFLMPVFWNIVVMLFISGAICRKYWKSMPE